MPETEDIFIQTFNGFDVWINGRAIYFSSNKAKELLAILVHKRRGSASLAHLAYLLYEETPEDTAKRNIRVVGHRLCRILKEHGCEELVIHRRGVYLLNTELFTCDLYEFMKGDRKYLSAYTGSYMPEYPWASDTVPYLDVIYGKYREG